MDNHFEVRGDVALIHLRRKKGPHLLSLVSTRILPDLERLHGSFYAMWHPHPRTFYVAMDPRGRGARIHLHRFVTKCPDDLEVDHQDGNGLNNTDKNVTPATRSENAQNVGVQSNNGTGYRGVHRIHGSRVKLPWKAELTVNGTAHYLGRFLTPEEARDAVQYAVESKDYTRKTPTGRIKSVAEAHGFSLSMLYKIVRGVYLCESPLANKAKEALIAAGVLTS